MRYKFEVINLNCEGCKNIIHMALKEEKMKRIEIDLETKIVTFETTLPLNDVKESIQRIFNAFDNYEYKNLKEATYDK